jgi:hypothetical protein
MHRLEKVCLLCSAELFFVLNFRLSPNILFVFAKDDAVVVSGSGLFDHQWSFRRYVLTIYPFYPFWIDFNSLGWGAILNPILDNFHISEMQAAWVGFGMTFAGMMSVCRFDLISLADL